jgi:hypothetical protein
MRLKHWIKIPLTVVFCALMLAGLYGSRAWAQEKTTAPSPPPAESISTATVPDVQIVISPDPSGQWVVAAVYPNKTDRKKAEDRAKEMLTLGKWKGSGLLFENKALERTDNPKGMAALPVMSSVTFSTPGNIVNYADGTVSLEPFIRAYRDLDKINLLFLIPGTFKYRGPKSYQDNDIEMLYVSGGSALTYVVQVKNHSLGALQLPRFEPTASVASSAQKGKSGAGKSAKMIGVIVLAVVAAGLAFFGVQRWNTR